MPRPTVRKLVIGSVVGTLLIGAVIAWSPTAWSLLREPKAATDMTAKADAFLASLDAGRREKATMAYDNAARTDWHFIPKPTRKGLQIRDMDQAQRQTALALLRASLSQTGYDKAAKIMELELLLAELEKTRVGGPLRDAERYYFTVFGKPTAAGRWGLSIEGHHLSLNFTVDAGRVVSSTPTVYATNPAVVKASAVPQIKVGTRVLALEETLAFDLLRSLTAEQRKGAIIAEKAPAEIRAAGEPQPPQDTAVGLAAAQLTSAQSTTLRQLLDVYAGNLPEDVAEARLAAIDQAGFEKIKFAWAGADTEGIGHYYRVQGPTFLIEFVNVQPDAAGNPANHIHSIWRDMAGDFAIAGKK
ncbi:MAG: DUF3500 domain-containing protein [Planctomycetia bacterium]|nr:DUF3500 domain-containing protein [Planctomycetia bacterium]